MPEKRYIVTLTDEERGALEAIVSKGQGGAHRIKHAHILLNADENGPNLPGAVIAQQFRCHFNTVANVRRRFVEHGLTGALERKKREAPPTPPKLDGRGEAQLIAIACGPPPEGCARWTLSLLADELVRLEIVDSISPDTVRVTLKKTKSSPTCASAG